MITVPLTDRDRDEDLGSVHQHTQNCMLGMFDLYLEVFELHYVRMTDRFQDLNLGQQILHGGFIETFLTDHLHSHRLPAVRLQSHELSIKTCRSSLTHTQYNQRSIITRLSERFINCRICAASQFLGENKVFELRRSETRSHPEPASINRSIINDIYSTAVSSALNLSH